jgi:hypothetical protein
MMIDLAARRHLPFWRAVGHSLEGTLLIGRGEFATGSALLRTVLDKIRYPDLLGVLAEGLAGLGRLTPWPRRTNHAHTEIAALSSGHAVRLPWHVPSVQPPTLVSRRRTVFPSPASGAEGRPRHRRCGRSSGPGDCAWEPSRMGRPFGMPWSRQSWQNTSPVALLPRALTSSATRLRPCPPLGFTPLADPAALLATDSAEL